MMMLPWFWDSQSHPNAATLTLRLEMNKADKAQDSQAA